MTKLEKIGLDHILQLVIDAEMHFNNSNKTELSASQRDDEWREANDDIKSAIELLTSVVNDDT